MKGIRKSLAGLVVTALALAGCSGDSSEPAASQPGGAAPAAATNYQIECDVNGVKITTGDYHEIWTKGGSDDCRARGGGGGMGGGAATEPFTAEQISAIAIGRTGPIDGETDGGELLGNGYAMCGETKAGSHFDPAKWSAADMPDGIWGQRVADLQVAMTLCPDHPWAPDWKSRIASRAVVSASR